MQALLRSHTAENSTLERVRVGLNGTARKALYSTLTMALALNVKMLSLSKSELLIDFGIPLLGTQLGGVIGKAVAERCLRTELILTNDNEASQKRELFERRGAMIGFMMTATPVIFLNKHLQAISKQVFGL